MPPFNPNVIVAIIKALTQLIPVLDKHRFGAVMLILVMVTTGAFMALPYLLAALA